MDLSDKEKRLIKEIPKNKGVTWSLALNKIFLYNIKKNQLQVLTTSFEPTSHPLADVINHYKDKINYTRIYPHPTLHFAILWAGKNEELIITWDSNQDKNLSNLFGDSTGITYLSFSPDGKWLVLNNEDFEKHTHSTYLMPVSEKYPHYLGSPILLQKTPYGKGDSAWTTNPVSFIGSDVGKLYRWDLENRDFPGKSKMSFHDYIVQEDLKKLTREKRQGLGK
jgi:WD40 repeat protein